MRTAAEPMTIKLPTEAITITLNFELTLLPPTLQVPARTPRAQLREADAVSDDPLADAATRVAAIDVRKPARSLGRGFPAI